MELRTALSADLVHSTGFVLIVAQRCGETGLPVLPETDAVCVVQRLNAFGLAFAVYPTEIQRHGCRTRSLARWSEVLRELEKRLSVTLTLAAA